MTKFIAEEFPSYTVIDTISDGINESHIFRSDSDIYVGKRFSSNLINTKDYLATIQIAKQYISDGKYLHTPNVHSFGTYDSDAYVIYEYVDGDQLDFETVYSNNRIEECLSATGRILAELHHQGSPVDGFGWFSIEESNKTDTDDKTTVKLKNGYDESLGLSLSSLNYNIGEIDDPEFVDRYHERIQDVFERYIDYRGKPSICHCDVKYNNLIDSQADRLYLIDWEFIRSADPLFEYVKTERQLLGRYSQDGVIGSEERQSLNDILSTSYFEHSPIEFDRERYLAYWILEMIQCFESCPDWYSADEVEAARNYYEQNIQECLEVLE